METTQVAMYGIITPRYVLHVLLIKITASQNEDALRYLKVRGIYFLAVIFAAAIILFVIL